MKKKLLFVLAPLLLLGVVVAGCAATVQQIEAVRDVAVDVQQNAQEVANAIEADLAKLPPNDPIRKSMEEKLVKVRAFLADMDTQLANVNAALAAFKKGELAPELAALLGVVPYGTYIGLALSVFFGIKKTLEKNQTMDALTRVVQSWEQVGAELTTEEKAKAYEIQGPAATTLVHQIKNDLVSK